MPWDEKSQKMDVDAQSGAGEVSLSPLWRLHLLNLSCLTRPAPGGYTTYIKGVHFIPYHVAQEGSYRDQSVFQNKSQTRFTPSHPQLPQKTRTLGAYYIIGFNLLCSEKVFLCVQSVLQK